MNHVLFYCDVRQTDIDNVKLLRRYFARLEGDPVRYIRREAVKWVRACTFMIRCFEGEANYKKTPTEQEVYIKRIADFVYAKDLGLDINYELWIQE